MPHFLEFDLEGMGTTATVLPIPEATCCPSMLLLQKRAGGVIEISLVQIRRTGAADSGECAAHYPEFTVRTASALVTAIQLPVASSNETDLSLHISRALVESEDTKLEIAWGDHSITLDEKQLLTVPHEKVSGEIRFSTFQSKEFSFLRLSLPAHPPLGRIPRFYEEGNRQIPVRTGASNGPGEALDIFCWKPGKFSVLLVSE